MCFCCIYRGKINEGNRNKNLQTYNPIKPTKWGYKLWVEADTDGYISKFEIYQGKRTDANESSAVDDNKFGLGEKVVETMTVDLISKNHEVYFGNFFTSVAMMEYLKENGVYASGTVGLNCKAIHIGMEEVLDWGECDYWVSKDGLVIFKRQDNKHIYEL